MSGYGTEPIARRAFFLAAAGLGAIGIARAQQATAPLRIGVTGDFSGPYSSITGEGTAVAARFAIADFGGKVLGRPIELLTADHHNKADVGLAIVREWFGPGGVSMVTNIANSSIAFGIQPILTEEHRIALYSTVGNADLVGKACSPLSAVWAGDTWSSTVAPIKAALQQGKDTFFLIAADYAFGKTLETDAVAAIEAGHGKVLGIVRPPLNAPDFSSYLLDAKASGAKVVMLLNAGTDLINAYKQAVEFRLPDTCTIYAPVVFLSDIRSLGLPIAQGLQFAQSWYWDLNDATRAWSKRFFAERQQMPGDSDAATYSSVLEYLRAVEKAGTDQAEPVMAALKAMEISDMYASGARVRADGRLLFDRYLVRAKRPEESTGPWDLLTVTGKIPAAEGFRSLAESGCRYVKS